VRVQREELLSIMVRREEGPVFPSQCHNLCAMNMLSAAQRRRFVLH